ncbi:transcriptional activator protein Pur-beta isoform X8 [Anastrepha obliqua]|nr:transcriptional activator protein Pur-beta isoform X8 [Anastrepha obliqua]XP_054746704.1 transcriptional activator protein Pur-beta isoform X8 [Anastrepha obliqua]XP_054746705.1 transcriptional activator protein Pur-beta isoform X8 [Anastrepha obliqua]XP_054746706.1 transcriptional activator protein Pur-beta isoform X8 [Anastrepha obliqua]XP_054746707.1 transcriptional activator protein Pur-beta isoform X8 [Anastrepha obliqua]
MEGTSGRSDFDSTGKAQAGAQQGEQELATKMLQIQSKRFYLDVKQNRRGRFIKVAEIGADGRRSQVYLALSTAAEFRDHLSTFSDYYASLVKFTGPPNPDNLPEDGKLKSEMMIKDNRRYYLDLKENARGRFLRVSQTITRGGPRSQIAIPAQGMIEFRDALTDLLEEFGTNDGGYFLGVLVSFGVLISIKYVILFILFINVIPGLLLVIVLSVCMVASQYRVYSSLFKVFQ